jgi:type II secretion system protein J
MTEIRNSSRRFGSASIGRPAPVAAVIRNTASAFTLIEILLALGVSAIVLAAIGGVFFSAMRLRDRTMMMLDEAAPMQQALALLRRDLKGAVPPGGMMAGSLQSGVVSGNFGQNMDGIELYTSTGVVRDNAPWGDIQKVTYQLQPSANTRALGKDLIRSVTRNLLNTTVEEAEDQWLMGNVQDLRFAYYDGIDWRDTWDSTMGVTNLPNAVRVRIQMADANGPKDINQDPIELIVPLVSQSRTNAAQTTATSP